MFSGDGTLTDQYDDFYELRQEINSSVSNIRNQINNILNEKTGSSAKWVISIFISIIVPFLYSSYSNINIGRFILTWIPISFAIIWFISLFSIMELIKNLFNYRKMGDEERHVMKNATEKIVKHEMERNFSNSMAPILYSFILIFSISLLLLLAVTSDVISSTTHGNLFLPIILSILIVVVSLLVPKLSTISYLTEGVSNIYKTEFSINKIQSVGIVIFYSTVLILPFSFAVWSTICFVENVPVFIVILVSEVFIFITIGSIFSRKFALEYLEDIAHKFENISSEISWILLNKNEKHNNYDKFKEQYFQLKKYSIRKDSSLFLFDFYLYDTDIKYLRTNLNSRIKT